jgi:hypothetical protein
MTLIGVPVGAAPPDAAELAVEAAVVADEALLAAAVVDVPAAAVVFEELLLLLLAHAAKSRQPQAATALTIQADRRRLPRGTDLMKPSISHPLDRAPPGARIVHV